MYVIVTIAGLDERLYLKISPSDTFGRLKEIIQGEKGCAPDYQQLRLRGMLMPDEMPLDTYGITAGEDECAEMQPEVTLLEEGPIPLEELAFLDDMWNLLGGEQWKRKPGWENRSTDPNNALGVTVVDQHIVAFVMPDNNLRGQIPESIANCTRLQNFQVPYNLLEGDIPSCIGVCTQMVRLSLQWNRFTGPIPESIGCMKGLQQFFADHNKLTGSIPEGIGECRQMIRMNLANNKLTGALPMSLCYLQKLEVLQLQYNNIVVSKEINLNMPAKELVAWSRWEKVKSFNED
jgi:hypothetical protein